MDAQVDNTGTRQHSLRTWLTACALLMWVALNAQDACAGAGTATPPAPGLGTLPALGAVAPDLLPPIFSAPQQDIIGFTAIGFLKSATVSDALCPGLPKAQWGGTAVINEVTIIIPCNTVMQMPAATFTWANLFDAKQFATVLVPPASLTLPVSTRGDTRAAFRYPSTEIRIEGNIVAGQHIAGLVHISQQSLNTGTGIITGFDHAKGVIFVGGRADGLAEVRLQLNDPNGRFSAGQSPDSRFSVDSDNPTIKASTGYPMCVPRYDPSIADDPACPRRNRPLTANGCRNFAAAGIFLPAGRDFAPPAPGAIYCSAFLMGDPATALDNEPNSREQAPFEIGDLIAYSGTLLMGDGNGPNRSDTISVHTITANVGIFTAPGTLPVYIAIGDFNISAEAPRFFNGVRQEAPNRLFLEASVTDVTGIVDIYLVDLDAVTGQETQRWITPASMTGGIGAVGSNGQIIDGGITTQLTGPQPGRARIRAVKSTPGILQSPTRYIRVVVRSLCDPANVNGTAPPLADPSAAPVECLKRATAANGLYTGQYFAPTPSFIFPENLVAGDPPVPYNFWALGFLVNGEGPATGPLIPTPW